jgi:hypothetical protein
MSGSSTPASCTLVCENAGSPLVGAAAAGAVFGVPSRVAT